MAYAAGVDVGSTQTKAVIIDEARRDRGPRAHRHRRQRRRGGRGGVPARRCRRAASTRRRSAYVVGTGYGRYKVTFGNTQVTEISCHGRGAVHMFPGTRTVVDMGGQDTKAIRVGPTGEIVDFCMNDKCAAGTGRFLGAAAAALDIPLGELGPTALRGERPVKISTTCTVFAESEVLSWLGQRQEDRGHPARRAPLDRVARRSACCAASASSAEVTFTGGVARNIGDGRSAERGARVRRSTSARTRTTWARWARRSSRSTTSSAEPRAGRRREARRHEPAPPASTSARPTPRRSSLDERRRDRRPRRMSHDRLPARRGGRGAALRRARSRDAGVARRATSRYVVSTGYGRFQVAVPRRAGHRPHGRRARRRASLSRAPAPCSTSAARR